MRFLFVLLKFLDNFAVIYIAAAAILIGFLPETSLFVLLVQLFEEP